MDRGVFASFFLSIAHEHANVCTGYGLVRPLRIRRDPTERKRRFTRTVENREASFTRAASQQILISLTFSRPVVAATWKLVESETPSTKDRASRAEIARKPSRSCRVEHRPATQDDGARLPW